VQRIGGLSQRHGQNQLTVWDFTQTTDEEAHDLLRTAATAATGNGGLIATR
jgi:hypothetical protein